MRIPEQKERHSSAAVQDGSAESANVLEQETKGSREGPAGSLHVDTQEGWSSLQPNAARHFQKKRVTIELNELQRHVRGTRTIPPLLWGLFDSK